MSSPADAAAPDSPEEEHQRLHRQIERIEEENEAFRFALGLQQQKLSPLPLALGSPSSRSGHPLLQCPSTKDIEPDDSDRLLEELAASSAQHRRERNAACTEIDRLTEALAVAQSQLSMSELESSELRAENEGLRQMKVELVSKSIDDEASMRKLQDQVRCCLIVIEKQLMGAQVESQFRSLRVFADMVRQLQASMASQSCEMTEMTVSSIASSSPSTAAPQSASTIATTEAEPGHSISPKTAAARKLLGWGSPSTAASNSPDDDKKFQKLDTTQGGVDDNVEVEPGGVLELNHAQSDALLTLLNMRARIGNDDTGSPPPVYM